MLEVYVILLLASTSAMALAPPYVQSNEAFMSSKTYLSEQLPPKKLDIHKPDDRIRLSFGMLATVTAGQVLSYRNSSYIPLLSLYKYVPIGWTRYQYVAGVAQNLIREATQKCSLVTDIIDTMCGAISVEDCNTLVENKVQESPNIYLRSADLLLSLGVVANLIRDNIQSIDSITKRNHDIPYLMNNVNTGKFNRFVQDLNFAYSKLQDLKFRRLYDF